MTLISFIVLIPSMAIKLLGLVGLIFVAVFIRLLKKAACAACKPYTCTCRGTLDCCVQTDRYAEYPKLKELVERKDGLIAARATTPTFLKVRFQLPPMCKYFSSSCQLLFIASQLIVDTLQPSGYHFWICIRCTLSTPNMIIDLYYSVSLYGFSPA